MPISGLLVCAGAGAVASIIEHSYKMHAGTYTQAKDDDSQVGDDRR